MLPSDLGDGDRTPEHTYPVIVGVDGSFAAIHAARWAAAIAERFEAPLEIVHAVADSAGRGLGCPASVRRSDSSIRQTGGTRALQGSAHSRHSSGWFARPSADRVEPCRPTDRPRHRRGVLGHSRFGRFDDGGSSSVFGLSGRGLAGRCDFSDSTTNRRRSRPRPRQPGRDHGGIRVRRSPGRGNPRCSRLDHQPTTGRCHASVQDTLGTSRKRCTTTSFGVIVAVDRSIPERRRRGDCRTGQARQGASAIRTGRANTGSRQPRQRACRPVGVDWTRAASPRNHPGHVLPLVRRTGLTGPTSDRPVAVRSQLMGLSTVSSGTDRR